MGWNPFVCTSKEEVEAQNQANKLWAQQAKERTGIGIGEEPAEPELSATSEHWDWIIDNFYDIK